MLVVSVTIVVAAGERFQSAQVQLIKSGLAYLAIASSIFVCFFFPRFVEGDDPVAALRLSPVDALSDDWLEPEAARRAEDRVPAILTSEPR